MATIFINYRREDAAAYAGRLHDRLSAEFGADQVFIDIDKLEPGQNFAEVIKEQVGHCETLIALIGPRWLTSLDSAGTPRLEDPDDFVRLEIAAALARDIRVVPVLVDDAVMPEARDLPPELAQLPLRQAHEIRHSHFHKDTGDLIEALIYRPVPSGRGDQFPDISGRWTVAATPSNGRTFRMAFNFRQSGTRVFGQVDFPVATAGVLDGAIAGNRLSFHTWHHFDDLKHRTEFAGEIGDQVIELDMQNEQDFYKLVARRAEQ